MRGMGKAAPKRGRERYDVAMRLRILFFALLIATGAFVLPFAAHAAETIPFFGPIIPQDCPAGWGMLVDVINRIIRLLLTLAIVFVAPLMIAYSGFLFVVNPVNAGGREQAKKILTNTIVGIVIALAAWMIVGAIMAVLYSKDNKLGAWESLILSGGGDFCLKQAGSVARPSVPSATAPGVTTGPGVSTVRTVSLNQPPPGKAGTACDPAVIQKSAAASNYTLTNTEANTLACIAQPESNCGAPNKVLNYKWDKGTIFEKGSTAAGAFQVLLSTNHKCYENYACYKAAGLQNAPLNCQLGFDNLGNPKKDSSGKPIPLVESCVRAAANLDCSITAAACLLKQNNGNFSPWQADINSAKQTGCIANK
jgi:hypothetical protein